MYPTQSSKLKPSSTTTELPTSQLLNAEVLKMAQKTYSEPMISVSSPAKAPKLTLFNVKYNNEAPKVQTIQNYVDDEDEDNESNNFIIPMAKNRSPAGLGAGDILRRVEKSKLSLMLNCLNDDLEEDAVDSAKETLVASSETKEAAEAVTADEHIVTKAPEITSTLSSTPSAVAHPISNETEKVLPLSQPLPSLATSFQLPVSSKAPSKEKLTPAAQPQLSANLISFSPAPSFGTVVPPSTAATSTVNFTANNSLTATTTPTITLPMPKPISTASIIAPKTLSFNVGPSTPSFGGIGVFGASTGEFQLETLI
jgi:nuclear pore complex protein Nup121